jgi:endonuclease/exonuclease/phosphatase family metal-dependent hydrolase
MEMLRRSCAYSLVLLALLGGCTADSPAPRSSSPAYLSATPPHEVTRTAGQPRDIRVMSFNLRVATLVDGPNYWDFRKGLVVDTINNFGPDLLGTQECSLGQANYLRKQLADYGFVGAGRNDGKLRGEMCAIFFRAARFTRLAEGHFWLSETPQVPGSRGWDAAFPRMVTWVKLRDRSSGSVLCFFNTHFDHRGPEARDQSARLLRQHIDQIAGNLPVIVSGDFNTDEGTAPYRTMLLGTGASIQRYTDTLRAVTNSRATDQEGTLHNFSGRMAGARIDWILTSGQFRTVRAAIDHANDGVRYPSDHFPVTAVLRGASAMPIASVR